MGNTVFWCLISTSVSKHPGRPTPSHLAELSAGRLGVRLYTLFRLNSLSHFPPSLRILHPVVLSGSSARTRRHTQPSQSPGLRGPCAHQEPPVTFRELLLFLHSSQSGCSTILVFIKPRFLPVALPLLLFQMLPFCGFGHSKLECVLKLAQTSHRQKLVTRKKQNPFSPERNNTR